MRTIRTVAELRAALVESRRTGARVGLVPTMGAFHNGHLSLMDRARRESDVVVVSVFVNPAQFAPDEDLAAYPRDEARDAALAAEHGTDLLFAPHVEEVYPEGFATAVAVTGPLTETLEGAQRGAAHFRGVTTMVTKLLNMASPDAAYFGRKDAQQAAVVTRLVSDLDLGVEVVVCPTVRESDGLAMSSRNAYLDPTDRARAVALWRGLQAVQSAVAAGEQNAEVIVSVARAAMAEHEVAPEYLEVVDPQTLAPVAMIDEALVLVAARVGAARLIDNTTVRSTAKLDGASVRQRPSEREARCSA